MIKTHIKKKKKKQMIKIASNQGEEVDGPGTIVSHSHCGTGRDMVL